MNVILIGYGKMGKAIDRLIKEDKSINVFRIIDEKNPLSKNDDLADVDVAIDFSEPKCVLNNVKILADKRVNCVLGTTGWYDNMEKMKEIVKSGGIGLVWDSNFSVGVNLFFEITKKAAYLFNRFKEYDISIHEVHHKAKKDSPSGTAIVLGNMILENNSNKNKINTSISAGQIEEEALSISSSRFGSVFGEHSIYFDSPEDIIELKHSAKGRDGFAKGAILAAKWIKGKTGIYRMKDVLRIK